MDVTAVSASAYAANLAPLPATLMATIDNPPSTPLTYQLKNSGSAVAGSSFTWQSSLIGSLSISFPSPTALGAGSFQGSVDLSVCLDAACTQPITGSPEHIMVTYVVEPGLQPAASFTIQPGPAQITSPLYTSQTTTTLDDFSFYVTNFPSSGLWLQIAQPAGGPITSAAFQNFGGPTAVVGLTLKSPATLGSGVYNDSVSFSLCYDSACQSPVAGSPMTEPIDFTVSTTAGIEYTTQTANVPGASFVAWDSANQQLYATAVTGGANPGALLQIDPVSGTVGPSLTLPVALTQLAISSDGQYAYVSTKDQPTIYRVQLPSLVPDLQIPLGSAPVGTSSVYQMAVAPGANQTLAVSLGSEGSPEFTAGVAIFDGATPRPNLLPPLTAQGQAAAIEWSDSAATLYALRYAPANPAPLSEIDLVNVTSSGLAVGSAFPIDLQTDGLDAIVYAGGRLYGNDAIVRDATTGATLGQFAVPSGYQVSMVLPDLANSRVFILADAPNLGVVLLCYNSVSPAMLSLAVLPNGYAPNYPLNMTLWGTNGIAFDSSGDSVVMLSGAFTPGAQGAHASPAIQRLAMPRPPAGRSAR